ncbi:MAG: hypothetical protein AAFV19_14780 [Pseudomonadota bacterium]
MSSVGFVPVLAFITMFAVLALVWVNIQQTMSELDKTRNGQGAVKPR